MNFCYGEITLIANSKDAQYWFEQILICTDLYALNLDLIARNGDQRL